MILKVKNLKVNKGITIPEKFCIVPSRDVTKNSLASGHLLGKGVYILYSSYIV